jgi:nicotinamide mononucleotide transporter
VIDWLAANWTEILGFGTGLACVYLAVRRNTWNYPIGLANNVVFLVLFLGAGLYATAGLQVVYAALAIHGWIRWTIRVEKQNDYIARTDRTQVAALMGAFVIIAAVLVWVLLTFTDSTVAVFDASTTSASLVAQYLLNRKRIENWFVWMAVDVVFAGLALASGLWITAILYVIFFVLCVYGYRSWLAVERVGQGGSGAETTRGRDTARATVTDSHA